MPLSARLSGMIGALLLAEVFGASAPILQIRAMGENPGMFSGAFASCVAGVDRSEPPEYTFPPHATVFFSGGVGTSRHFSLRGFLCHSCFSTFEPDVRKLYSLPPRAAFFRPLCDFCTTRPIFRVCDNTFSAVVAINGLTAQSASFKA